MGNRGKREFIQILRLMKAAPQDVVAYAVTEGIRLGAIGLDAVKQITLARIERRPVRLDLAAYPHLPPLAVKTTTAADVSILTMNGDSYRLKQSVGRRRASVRAEQN